MQCESRVSEASIGRLYWLGSYTIVPPTDAWTFEDLADLSTWTASPATY
ncbi:hypothetical protein PAECIP111802_07358 [Paenibacillus allorhizosphaerae]|uniref:Uncharacterized protein n=1 Tax=Paenibacillus allorhizosphaerae TaxID=2849866 RepID=A0ABN7TX85_9BACL|nr:hypothetical protein PAECIP111802_07358 [Paenibacillus allorhizosphaerae]